MKAAKNSVREPLDRTVYAIGYSEPLPDIPPLSITRIKLKGLWVFLISSLKSICCLKYSKFHYQSAPITATLRVIPLYFQLTQNVNHNILYY